MAVRGIGMWMIGLLVHRSVKNKSIEVQLRTVDIFHSVFNDEGY
jgi:hypothetical protein